MKEVHESHESMRNVLRYASDDVLGAWDSADQVRPALETLKKELLEHFQEEAEGFLAEIPSRNPRLIDGIGAIKEEHNRLITMADAILALAEADGDPEAIRDDFRVLADWLRDHERRESELLLSAYDDDIGDGD